MASLSVGEVVEKLNAARTKNERIQILRENDSAALRGILRMNFDESLVLALPKGAPPFNRANVPNGFGNTTLKASATGWYVFVRELSPNLSQSKRESIFIQLLESLDSREADILIQAKDRSLDVGVTKKLIGEVFPGLIRAEITKHGNKKESVEGTTSSVAGHGQGV